MKIGDIIRNDWAGDKNPYKFSIFIGKSGRTMRLLCFDGHIAKHTPGINDPEMYHVVGHVDIVGALKQAYLIEDGNKETCPECGGSGEVGFGPEPEDYGRCPGCNGTGKKPEAESDVDVLEMWDQCPKCDSPFRHIRNTVEDNGNLLQCDHKWHDSKDGEA